MPTNRNNNEVVKSFAIGTKIEYMNKLFEVTESNSCCDCSLATICSSSNISSGDRNDNALSRDERINIFGQCSRLRRLDKKSIVFVEVPMNKSDNNTINSNIIQPLVEANGTVKALQIKAPTNFKIDIENSDLDKGIIKFKNKWLTLKELYEIAKKNDYLTYRSLIKDFKNAKLLALATFMDIISYFNGDWKFNAEKDNHGYAITFYYNTTEYPQYHVVTIDSTSDIYYGNPVFKNEADAQYVIDNPNFRDILDNIFKV